QLGDLQCDLAGGGVQPAGVGAGAEVGAVRGALVAPGAAQGVGLGVEQGVEGVLDGAADQAIDVGFELGLVDLDELHGIARNISYTTHATPLGVWQQSNPTPSTVGRPRGCPVRKCER